MIENSKVEGVLELSSDILYLRSLLEETIDKKEKQTETEAFTLLLNKKLEELESFISTDTYTFDYVSSASNNTGSILKNAATGIM